MAPSVTRIDPPQRRGITVTAAVAAVLLCAAVTAIAWGLGGDVHITTDGTERTVAAGTTVGDLALAHDLTARPGTLYTANGGIISVVGGDPVIVYRNGRPVTDDQQVFEGDVIRSQAGADRTERVVTVKESIDPTATIVGSGPILKVVSPGKPGTWLVHKGSVSGEILSHTVLEPAQDIVLSASMPTSADKIVALTFDDGPWPSSTLKIVSILKQAGVPATFFEIGEQVRRWKKLSAAVAAAGNVVGNHSWSHPLLTKMKPPAIRKQLVQTAAAIKAATGKAPVVFRPPYGAINHSVWMQAKAAKESIVLWDVDTLDWTRPGPSKILSNVTSEIGRASIVLMHDGGGDRTQTIAALPSIIAWLKANGYTFLTVPQLEATR